MDEESPNNTRTNISKEDIPEIATKLGINSSYCKNDNFLIMVINTVYAFAMQTRAKPDSGVGHSCLNILIGMPLSVVDHLAGMVSHVDELKSAKDKASSSKWEAESKLKEHKKSYEKQLHSTERYLHQEQHRFSQLLNISETLIKDIRRDEEMR
jgi:hypothetical protein